MKSRLHTIPTLLVLGLCIYFTVQSADSQYVPNRCSCLHPSYGVRGPFSDFTVTLKRPGCKSDEIIVVLKTNDQKVCLSPDGPQGKRLLKCWHRKQKEGKTGKRCMGRLRPRRRKMEPKPNKDINR